MTFLVSPQEAQAMQEDEAQLVAAIAQAARGAVALTLLRQAQLPVIQPPDTLQIRMGRRLVYGKLADGPFRNELDANTLKVISDALQRPVDEAADPAHYRGKVPAIEIRDGSTILFREERDGTVTVNQIQFQIDQTKPLPTGQLEPPLAAQNSNGMPLSSSAEIDTQPEDLAPSIHALEVARIAAYLLNPLNDESPIYDAVAIGEYRIKRNGNNMTVSRGESLILVALDGEVITDRVEVFDWQAFQRLRRPERHLLEVPAAVDGFSEIAPEQDAPILQPDLTESLMVEDVPPAIAILERETEKLPEGATKQLLQTTAQNWKQQVIWGLATGVQQGIGWLVSRPEVLSNQRLAGAALELFRRGYERTGQQTYFIGEYSISLKGQNLYTLQDGKEELLRFQAFKSAVPGIWHRVQVVSVSDRLSEFQRQDILAMQRDRTTMPQGDLDIEARYAAKTRAVEQTVKEFLQVYARATVWDKEGGHFKLEMGEGDFLRITDKRSNREVVFQRQNGEVFSKLGPKDFAHFKRLANRMNKQQQAPQSQVKPGASPALQSSGLELE